MIVFFIAVRSSLLFSQDTAEGFTLVKDKGNISIYERWIHFPKTSPPVEAREVKGVFFAKTSIDHGLALIRNEKKIQDWQSHVSKFKVYPQTDSTWYEYSYHDIPWPVSDQDHFLVYEIEENVPGEKLFVTFESLGHPTLAPIDEDATRMKLAGSWLFEKQAGRIKITYRILSMPSSIPRMFTDPVIRNNMMSTITSYIGILEDASK